MIYFAVVWQTYPDIQFYGLQFTYYIYTYISWMGFSIRYSAFIICSMQRFQLSTLFNMTHVWHSECNALYSVNFVNETVKILLFFYFHLLVVCFFFFVLFPFLPTFIVFVVVRAKSKSQLHMYCECIGGLWHSVWWWWWWWHGIRKGCVDFNIF